MSESHKSETLTNQSSDLDEVGVLGAKLVAQLVRNWRFIALFVTVVTGLFTIFIFTRDREYTASGTVMLSQEGEGGLLSKMAGVGMSSLSSLAGLNKNTDAAIVEQFANSRSIGLAAIKRFHLDSIWKFDSTKLRDEDLFVHWNSKFLFQMGSNDEMVFTFRDGSPKRSADVLNWVIHRADSLFVAARQSQARNAFEYYQRLSDEKLAALGAAEDSILNFQLKNKAFVPPANVSLELKKAAELEAQSEMLDIKIRMARETNGPGSSDESSLQAMRNLVTRRLGQLKNDPTGAPTGNIPGVLKTELRFDRMLREVEHQGLAYKLLIQQMEIQRAEVAKSSAALFFVDSVRVPQKPTSPKRLLLVQLVFSLSLIASVCFVLLKGRIFAWIALVKLFLRKE